jgi:hypothetical protein
VEADPMPDPKEAKKLGVNPWAICSGQGHKQGTKEHEDCVYSVMASARKKHRAGTMKKTRPSSAKTT